MKLSLISYQLKTKNVFRIAHGSRTHTDTLIVKIEKDGITAFGEAAHVPYYGIEIDESIKEINAVWEELEPLFGEAPETFWAKANDLLGQNNFAKCALDIAHYDWLSQKSEQPLWQYLGLQIDSLPKSSYTILIDTPEKMGEMLLASNFPSFKVKLGLANDVEIMEYLRSKTNLPLRVDANGGWKLENAIALANKMESLGVEFIEQPFPKDAFKETAKLQAAVNVPLIGDESIIDMHDVEWSVGVFEGVNVKLGKCGGIYPSLLMLKRAKELGLKTMLGCSTESSIGISALAHLASLTDFMDMDGAEMIKNDPASGVYLEKGAAIFNDKLGHGASLNNGII